MDALGEAKRKFQEAFDVKMLLLGVRAEASSPCPVRIASRAAESLLLGLRTQPLFRDPANVFACSQSSSANFLHSALGSWFVRTKESLITVALYVGY
jgi:hypothetical protein